MTVSVEKGQSTTIDWVRWEQSPSQNPNRNPNPTGMREKVLGKVEVGGTDSDSNNTDKDNPETGDDNGLELAIAAMLISAAGAATAFPVQTEKSLRKT